MAKPDNESGADNSPMNDGQYDEHTTTPIIDNCNYNTHLVHNTMTNNYLNNFLPPPPPPLSSKTKRSPTLQPRKQRSSTPVQLYLLDQQLNSSVLLSAVSSSISCSSSTDSINLSKVDTSYTPQYKQQLPPTTKMNTFSRVGSWKAKKKEAKAKKLQRSSGSTPIMSNRKQIDTPLASNSSTNLFLQMNDEEVGNHSPATSMSPNRNSVVTSSTSPTTSLSSHGLSTPDRSGKERGSQSPEDRTALGGIKFHPHHAVDTQVVSSPVKKSKQQTEKRSPKSVITDSLDRHDSVGASSSDSTQLTGTPPRKTKEFFTVKQQQSQSQGKQSKKKIQPINNVDSSLASEVEDSKSYATNTVTDTYTYNDETTNGESTFVPGSISDQANPSIGIGTRLGIMVGKKLEHKIHDFITGNLCWSLNDDGTTKSVTDGGILGGCTNNAAVQCAELQTTELIDDIRNYNYDEESSDEDEDSTTLDTNSFEDTMSYYTSDEDEDEDDDRYKRKKKSNKSQQLTKSKKKKMLHKKPPSGKQSRRGPNRRGRSPTSKLSYNSDGESLVSGMSRGTSRGNSSRANSSISTYGDRAASLSVSTNRSSKSPGASSSVHRDKAILDRHNEASTSSSDGSLNGKGRDPSVVESVLTNDQAAWMAMTKQQASTDDSELALLAGNMNGDNKEGGVQEVSAVDGYFKVSLLLLLELCCFVCPP